MSNAENIAEFFFAWIWGDVYVVRNRRFKTRKIRSGVIAHIWAQVTRDISGNSSTVTALIETKYAKRGQVWLYE